MKNSYKQVSSKLILLRHVVGFALIASCLASISPIALGQETMPRTNIENAVEYDGIVRPSRIADISLRFDGLIQSLNFRPGDVVEEGQLLVQVNTLEQRYQLRIEEAARAEAQSELASAEADLARATILRDRDTISEAQLDQATAKRDVAEAVYEGATARVERRKIIISEYSLYAPFEGVVSEPLANEGTWFTLGSRDDNTIATVRQNDPVYVETSVPYKIYARRFAELGTDETMKARLVVRLILPNGETYKQTGRIIGGADRFDEATQTIKTIAAFPNPDYFLRPGLKVRLRSTISDDDDG